MALLATNFFEYYVDPVAGDGFICMLVYNQKIVGTGKSYGRTFVQLFLHEVNSTTSRVTIRAITNQNISLLNEFTYTDITKNPFHNSSYFNNNNFD